MSQLDIKIRKLQDNGSTFRANIETLYLGGVRSAKVDELRFELPEEWKNCTVTLHVQRLSGTKPDPQLLDEQNSALVDRRWTLEKEGTWMLLAINDSGYIAMTKPGKYTCYDTIDTDTTTENITPSIYEQFVAEVTKYAKQALESMNAAKASEEAAAKSAKEAANSAASMEESVRVSGENAKKAANSAAAAKKSEEAAAKSAEVSENSAKKSAESESASKASAEKAKDSEEAAKKSEDAAALSETNAAASEKNAKTSETNAKSSETKAATSADNAKTSETNAKASADSMGTSVATCTAKAKEAEASAGKAAASEKNAKTSEGNAKASENEARQLVEAAKKVVNTDKTLTIDGAPADAKTVGDKFKSIFERIKSIKMDWNSVTDKPETFPSTWDNVSGKPSSYPPSGHTHSYITNGGDVPAITGVIGTKGVSLQQVYNNGYPTTYGNVLSIGGSGDGQILAGWSGSNNGIERLYYRNRRDCCGTWSDWRTVAFTTDITQVTSQTSDPGAGSSLATGTVLLVYA